MINILCLGDSNTFGSNPLGGRHSRQTRWTGILQETLGRDYYVIEEGMGGRTTVWDDPYEPNRSGKMALPIILQSHKPIDLVILSLGTNDCKAHFHASAKMTAKGAELLCHIIKTYDYGDGMPIPEILLVSPIHIGADLSRNKFDSFDETSVQKSIQLATYYQATAKRLGCLFLDAAEVAVPSDEDQLHMDAMSHRALAMAIADKITVWQEEKYR
ncbi:MAG: SGNH/GDSL hydrolase family protein [Lachnospiraceae bacterium]|nr:SGNH/GDSL hydrolase family protein [Lachnospiraceae bacterium]